jgi:hypothetical protein
MTLFDPSPYWLHPGLWPPAGPDVLSDDEAAELLWPSITGPGEVGAVSETGESSVRSESW